MRDFALEVFFSHWEFAAKHHMTASDIESLTINELLSLAPEARREQFLETHLGYTETWGVPALRQAIADTYDTMSADNVLCLTGAGEGLYALARVLLSADDHAIVPTPNYQSAETVPLSVCEVTGVAQRSDSTAKGGWRLDLDDIRQALKPNTKLVSLNMPNNPTGMLMPVGEFHELIEICRQRGIYLLCDEVYRGVELEDADRLPQIADVYERGISLNVMSKAYGMPGLRLGWLVSADRDLLSGVERYKHYLSICSSAPSEFLAQVGLEAREQILARNRDLLRRNVVELEALFADYPDLFEWHRPSGGCVAFPRYCGDDGVEAFCRSALEQSGVLLLPASIYRSELTDVPKDRFRVGFGRDQVFRDGLAALRLHLESRSS